MADLKWSARLVGGPFDQHSVVYLPTKDSGPHPLALAVGVTGRVTMRVGDDYELPERNADLFVQYRLYVQAGRDDLEPIRRYVYEGVFFRPDPEAVVTNATPTK